MAEEPAAPGTEGAGVTGGLTDKKFIALTLTCALVGIAAGLLTSLFFEIVFPTLNYIWVTVPQDAGIGTSGTAFAVYTVVLCTLGGLIVGATIKFTRVQPTILAEEMEEVSETGRMKPRNGVVNMITGSLAIIFGGAVGPEGPLVAGSGAMGTWLGDKMKLPKQGVMAYTFSAVSGTMGSFFGNPFAMSIITIEGSLEKGRFSWRMLIPGIIASTTGYVTFFVITGYVFGGRYTFPLYVSPALMDLVYAVFLGVLGAAVGLAFIYFFRWMRERTMPFRKYPIALAVSGGLVLGIVGALFPLAMFTGETQVQNLINEAASLGVIMLIVLALLKIFLTSWCVGTGWAGGYIFPTLFMGAAIGLAVSMLLPFIPTAVCLVCVMGAVFVSVFKAPIAVTMITAMLFSATLIPAATIAVITSLILTYTVELLPKKAASTT